MRLRNLLLAATMLTGSAFGAAYSQRIATLAQLQGYNAATMASVKSFMLDETTAGLGTGWAIYLWKATGAGTPDGNSIIAPSDHPGVCTYGCLVKTAPNDGFLAVASVSAMSALANPSTIGHVTTMGYFSGEIAGDGTYDYMATCGYVDATGTSHTITPGVGPSEVTSEGGTTCWFLRGIASVDQMGADPFNGLFNADSTAALQRAADWMSLTNSRPFVACPLGFGNYSINNSILLRDVTGQVSGNHDGVTISGPTGGRLNCNFNQSDTNNQSIFDVTYSSSSFSHNWLMQDIAGNFSASPDVTKDHRALLHCGLAACPYNSKFLDLGQNGGYSVIAVDSGGQIWGNTYSGLRGGGAITCGLIQHIGGSGGMPNNEIDHVYYNSSVNGTPNGCYLFGLNSWVSTTISAVEINGPAALSGILKDGSGGNYLLGLTRWEVASSFTDGSTRTLVHVDNGTVNNPGGIEFSNVTLTNGTTVNGFAGNSATKITSAGFGGSVTCASGGITYAVYSTTKLTELNDFVPDSCHALGNDSTVNTRDTTLVDTWNSQNFSTTVADGATVYLAGNSTPIQNITAWSGSYDIWLPGADAGVGINLDMNKPFFVNKISATSGNVVVHYQYGSATWTTKTLTAANAGRLHFQLDTRNNQGWLLVENSTWTP